MGWPSQCGIGSRRIRRGCEGDVKSCKVRGGIGGDVILALWAFGGCTIPIDVGGHQIVPRWAGTNQDVDGDGLTRDVDCDDAEPGVGAPSPEICDQLDNDCDGRVDEDGVCAVTELFELHGNLDLLLVIDASDAATEVREQFIDVLPSILQPLYRDEVTAQIAVVGANASGAVLPWGVAGGEPFLRTWTSDLAGATAWVIDAIDSLPGDVDARPLDVARAAVLAAAATHESFDRPRTKLSMLFVAPGRDASVVDPARAGDDLSAAENGLWSAWAVMPLGESSCEQPKTEVAEPVIEASPLRDFVLTELGSDHLYDSCGDTLDLLRARLADDGELIAGTSRSVYPLGHAFKDGSLVVRHVYEGYDELLTGYIPSARTLTFPDPLPAEGVLQVEYDLEP